MRAEAATIKVQHSNEVAELGRCDGDGHAMRKPIALIVPSHNQFDQILRLAQPVIGG